MKQIQLIFGKYIQIFILIFLISQPILDVIAAFNQTIFNFDFGFNIIVRIIFLVICIFYLLFLNQTKYKKISFYYILILLFYFILFSIQICTKKDISIFLYEFKNLIITFYFPIILVTCYNLFLQYKIKVEKKYLWITFLIYILCISIPNILGIGLESYTQGKVGNSGWFISANSISSILSILLPTIICYVKEKNWNIIKLVIFSILFLYVIFSLGTKVPILSLIIIIGINILIILYQLYKRKHYKKILCILLSTICLIIAIMIIIPKTSFYKNIQIHLDFLGVENVSEIVTNPIIIDRFIFSDRLTFLKTTHKNYKKSSICEKLIGLGYIENYGTDEARTKLVEIDYMDIFYKHGVIGFILFFLPIIPITYQSVINKNFNTFENNNHIITIILIFLIAFFSGHILINVSISIFLAILLLQPIYIIKEKSN